MKQLHMNSKKITRIMIVVIKQCTISKSLPLAVSIKLQEEKLRGRPGYEHLNESLHILIEADLPANVVDIRLRQAQEIIGELLKPVVRSSSNFVIL